MRDPLTTVSTTLVRRLCGQHEGGGTKLLVTIFGDAIVPRGGVASLASMIELAAPFGVRERLVRTAMARLAAEGWLDKRRKQGRSEYMLSATGLERYASATRRIHAAPEEPWQKSWTIVIFPPHMRQSERHPARRLLKWAGFGEPASGVFAHPNPELEQLEQLWRQTPGLSRAIILTTGPSPTESHRQLAALGWNWEEIRSRYRRFITRFEPVLTTLRECKRPAPLPSFVIRVLLIHEYRKTHLYDSFLPAELLPADWPASDAYRICHDIYARVIPSSEEYLSAHAATLEGPLPPADQESLRHFVGMASVHPSQSPSPAPARGLAG